MSFATIYVTREISTEWKFILEVLNVSVTTSSAQYELLLDSGRFWGTLILIRHKNLPCYPAFKYPFNAMS